VFDEHIFSAGDFLYSARGFAPEIHDFSKQLWRDYFKKPIDTRPEFETEILLEIRAYFFKCEWYEVYDFTEFLLSCYGNLEDDLNNVLERELSGYRIIDGTVAPITSKEELQEIETAIQDSSTSAGASTHIRCALELLSNRTKPDYRNSIKESISAVENMCVLVSGKKKATLADALKSIEEKRGLHKALKDGFMKLYGYTSDDDGIRHSLLAESKLTQADAMYFLVSCSAFVNYLKIIAGKSRT